MKKRVVWSAFELKVDDASKAVCNYCKKEISRGAQSAKTYSTSALMNHVRSVHKAEFAELEKKCLGAETQSPDRTQQRPSTSNEPEVQTLQTTTKEWILKKTE